MMCCPFAGVFLHYGKMDVLYKPVCSESNVLVCQNEEHLCPSALLFKECFEMPTSYLYQQVSLYSQQPNSEVCVDGKLSVLAELCQWSVCFLY